MNDNDPDYEHGRNRRSLAALAVVALLVIALFFLGRRLASMAEIQDCVWQGRTNCAPLATTPGD
jgi:hypothetical protein